jgi:DnaJ family protein C protein 9
MSAATILSQAYGEGACLYETVLEVPRNATPSQLRKAYYKKALKYHPDKLNGDLSTKERDAAKIKFQAISMAYTILSDEEKRAEYDESGDLYDDDDLSANKSGVKQWTDYFKNIFPTVTTADIDAFEVKYKCSDEEEADVLKYYSQFKGDLNKMIECVMLSSDADKERWVTDYINPAIESGNVKDYSDKLKKTMGSAPTKKSKSKGGRSKPNKMEVEEDDMSEDDDAPCAEVVDDEEMETDLNENNHSSQKSKGKSATSKASPKKKAAAKKAAAPGKSKKSSDDDLIAQIRGKALARRQEGFDSMMAGLEERYESNKKGRGKKKHEIPDDEFEKIQAKLMKNRKK